MPKVNLNGGIEICLFPHEEKPYSFFHWIFIHGTVGIDDILVHEVAHAWQWHSIDILVGETVRIVC